MLTVLEKVGIVCIAIVGFHITRWLINFLYYNFIGPGLNTINFARIGKWAVVTGATDGVGKAYAELLAKKGVNIVLISRTLSKLEAVAADIEKEHNVQTKVIAVDFTRTKEIYDDIEKQLLGLEIGTLVNNVGMSYPYPEYFTEVKDGDELFTNLISCNIYSVTNMCKIVLPGMIERRRGVVINVSSSSAQIPSPLLTVYAATKAYVTKFSEDLGIEYAKYSITVQSTLPGYVATKMSKIRSATWMAPSPRTYVKSALCTVGVEDRTTGYFPHTLLVGTVHAIYCISPKLAKWLIVRTMENIRNRARRRNMEY